jgi:hypothetical protein
MGTGLMIQLVFASPLPIFLSPANLKFSVQEFIEESLHNFITLYILIILTLYVIGEIWGK